MTAPIPLGTQPLDVRGSLYERISSGTLHDLITRFYGYVAQDAQLSPIFPADLTLTAQKQEAFLTGFLGGPPLYHQRYGNPMLRARHLPFAITPARAAAWLACMQRAIHNTPTLGEREGQELLAALSRVAQHMVNTHDDG